MIERMMFRDDKVHVQRKMCSTCIFRPGNLMHLEEGRVEQMISDCGDTGVIPCHEHMDTDAPGVCKGFYNLNTNWVLRLAQAKGAVRYQ